MNKDLVNYIKYLTQKDDKNLSQKTFKTVEEVGELAKKVLAFDKPNGLKFTERKSILEEVSDIILTSLSIAYDLGFDDDDIDSVVRKKLLYWNEVQNRKSPIKPDEIPFELHVYVKLDNNSDDINRFKDSCFKIGVKAIVNEDLDQETIQAVTSSNIISNNAGAYYECKRISQSLLDEGFKVEREKIETVPWHPTAPSNQVARSEMIDTHYFESHFTIICNPDRKNFLEIVLSKWDCHLNQNVFSKLINGDLKVMATYRVKNCSQEKFKDRTKIIKRELKGHGFDVDKVVKEFCIYDTNESIDLDWILKG